MFRTGKSPAVARLAQALERKGEGFVPAANELTAMPEQGISFRIDEPPVLIGAAALLLWLSSERLLQLLGLRQPKVSRRETLSFYLHMFSFFGLYGAVFFSFLDATVFHWTTVGSSLSSLALRGHSLCFGRIRSPRRLPADARRTFQRSCSDDRRA